jgi:hypothetical protein
MSVQLFFVVVDRRGRRSVFETDPAQVGIALFTLGSERVNEASQGQLMDSDDPSQVPPVLVEAIAEWLTTGSAQDRREEILRQPDLAAFRSTFQGSELDAFDRTLRRDIRRAARFFSKAARRGSPVLIEDSV